ncbi:hypothetical protein FisN_5Hh053 [Fistulifera solaris]|uniref:CBM6 domain-containing protein n=1 Tax=Fistulifera solaris TaxID=1519565 RepID=A0A1Z5JUF5_FISSO|nr:hypothetical protein FisN_5Hh053 [Fistulifera solaris]|eukprot:GAX17408.1 hypothetical protein FisN_5Hh053 [Fistulifera solaris]
MDGITTGTLADGSSFIGFLDPSDWVSYNVLLPFTGTYRVDVSVASPEGAGSFQVANMMTREVYGTFDDLPASGDWTEWRTASELIGLPEGEWMMELTILETGMNIKSVTISPIEPAPSEAPVNESSVVPSLPPETEVPVIPDVSGNSSYIVPDDAYSITIPASMYASMDGVEMAVSPSGESIVESLDPGDWIAYPVSLPKAGPFMMEMNVSSPSGEGSFEVYNLITRELYTRFDRIPANQNVSQFSAVSAVVILPDGDFFLEISVIEGGWKLQELSLTELEEISTSNSTLPPGLLFTQTIEAVNYSSMNGIAISEDTNGNQVVSGLDAGDWVAYPLNLPFDGTYRLEVSVASPQGQGSFAVENLETEEEYKFVEKLAFSGTWENYTTVETFLVLPAGLWTMKVHAIEPGWNLHSLTLSKDGDVEPSDFNITIPAIDYSDMTGIEVQESASGESYIGFIDAGDALSYELSLPARGIYSMQLRVATPMGEGRIAILDKNTTEDYGIVTDFPPTGDWNTFEMFSTELELPGGAWTMQMEFLEGGFNLEMLGLTLLQVIGTDPPTIAPSISSTDELLFNLEISAVEYSDMTGIEVQESASGESYIGFIDAGDALSYELSLPARGIYSMQLRVATPMGEGRIAILDKNTTEDYGIVTDFPPTGDWNTFEMFSTELELPGGAWTMQMEFLEGGFNLEMLGLTLLQVIGTDPPTMIPSMSPTAEPLFRITIPAVNFTYMVGIAVQETAEGDPFVGFIDAGDSVAYRIDLPARGIYTLQARLASPIGEGLFTISDWETLEEYAFVDKFPPSADWESFETVSKDVELPGGEWTMQVEFLEPGFNLERLILTLIEEIETEPPISDVPTMVPSAISLSLAPSIESLFTMMIPAVDYSDMTGIEVQETADGDPYVGFIDPGDSLSYGLDLPARGLYSMQLRVATPLGEGRMAISDKNTTEDYGLVTNFPATGDWDTFEVFSTELEFPGGAWTMQIEVLEGGFNLEMLGLTLLQVIETDPPTNVPTMAPTAEPLFRLTIAAVNFAYMEGIAVQETAEGEVFVGYIDAGDSIAYELNLPARGIYSMQLKVATPLGEGRIALSDWETFLDYGMISNFPPTGDWNTFEIFSTELELPGGAWTLLMEFLEGGFNLEMLSFTLLQLVETDPPTIAPSISPTVEPLFRVTIPAVNFTYMEGIAVQESAEGEIFVGYIDPGDAVAYDLNLPTRGIYSMQLRVATPLGTGRIAITNVDATEAYGLVSEFPPTGDWDTFEFFSTELELPGGAWIMQLEFLEGGFNLEMLGLTLLQVIKTDPPTVAPSVAPTAEPLFRVTIPAVNFTFMEGIAIQETAEGETFVGYIDAGDSIAYDLNLPARGIYSIQLLVASPIGTGQIAISDWETFQEYGLLTSFPASGDWNTFEMLSAELELPGGAWTMQMEFLEAGFNLQAIGLTLFEIIGTSAPNMSPITSLAPNASPTSPVTFDVLIPAANYLYMEGVTVQNSSQGTAFLTGLDTGDSVAYAVSIPATGVYSLQASVGSLVGEGKFVVANWVTFEEYAFIDTLPSTGDLAQFDTVTTDLDLAKGPLIMQIEVIEPGFSLESLRLSSSETQTITPTATIEPSGNLTFDPTEIPTQVPTEVPLFVLEIPAVNFTYMDGISIEKTEDGVPFVGYIDLGDSVSYSVLLPFAGSYKLQLNVASPEGTGQMKISNWETFEAYGMIGNFPTTADWATYELVSTDLDLPGGEVILHFEVIEPGFNLESLVISLLEAIETLAPSEAGSSPPLFYIEIPVEDFLYFENVEVLNFEGEPYLGSLAPGSSVAYSVELPSTGAYKLHSGVGSPDGKGAFGVSNWETWTEYAFVNNFPVTGSLTSWETVSTDLSLPAGNLILQIEVYEGEFTLQSLALELTEGLDTNVPVGPIDSQAPIGPGESLSPTRSPIGFNETMSPTGPEPNPGTTAPTVTQTEAPEFYLFIPAPNYTSSNGDFGLETAEDGTQNIAFLDPGDWLGYDISLPYEGRYRLEANIASQAGNGSFVVTNVETQEEYAFVDNLPVTGDWNVLQYTMVLFGAS